MPEFICFFVILFSFLSFFFHEILISKKKTDLHCINYLTSKYKINVCQVTTTYIIYGDKKQWQLLEQITYKFSIIFPVRRSGQAKMHGN